MAFEAKIVEFPGGRRVSQLKNLSWEGYRYFLEQHNLEKYEKNMV